MAGTPTTGGTAAGTAGTFSPGGGGMGTGGSGGTAAGSGGTAGGGTGGLGGFGGTPPMIVPTQIVIDNVRLAPKGMPGAGGDGAGGAGGAGGDGAGGAGSAGAPIDVIAGAAGMDAGGGAGPVGTPQDFFLTFDADAQGVGKNTNGFSPSVGGTAGPILIDTTTLLWDAAAGKPAGALKASIPFSVKSQQADFFGSFSLPNDLTGYELTADVKMSDVDVRVRLEGLRQRQVW
jgi:hypothetical protein